MNDHAAHADTAARTGGDLVKRGMAEMLKGGVIMDVVTAEQARIAEDAGAVAVTLGEAMVGINVDEIPQPHRLAERGW